MKSILSSRKHLYPPRVTTLLTIVALIAVMIPGIVGCNGTPTQYALSISSTTGGDVTHPGVGTFTYPAGAVVLLEVEPEEGYGFTHWSGNVSTIEDTNTLTTTITMNGHYFITANFAYGQFIQTWYDLGGYYILMNDLGSTTAGYTELAGDVANEGEGWQPFGTYEEPFTGLFDGQGYEISDLFIDRSDGMGLFGWIGEEGIVKNVGIVDANVTGGFFMGALVGSNEGGTVSNCYSTGSVTASWGQAGGLVGYNAGTISNSYSTCTVSGDTEIGGLIGSNWGGTVDNSYATGTVTGEGISVGGLVGVVYEGTVSDCYATGDVTGDIDCGGLIGDNSGIVSNCHASGSVTGEGNYGDLTGGLMGANGGTVSNSYSTGSVTGVSRVGGLMGGMWAMLAVLIP